MGAPQKRAERSFTYGDYRGWRADERWEIIAGTAFAMSPAPGREHQAVVRELLVQIGAFLRGKRCRVYPAPFDVRLPETPGQDDDQVPNVVQPDLVVVCDRRKLDERGCRGAPDWVIEVLSPVTALRDLREKHALYEKHGVREYWIVDPAHRVVLVHRVGRDGRYRRAGVFAEGQKAPVGLFRKLTIDLSAVFASG
jgi:Uma2 family endonuclease